MRLAVMFAVVGATASGSAQRPGPPLGLEACADPSALCYAPEGQIKMAGTTAGEGEGQDYKLLAPGETASILTIEGPAVLHRIWSTSQFTAETRLVLKVHGEETVLWERGKLPEGKEADPLCAVDGQAYWSYQPIEVRRQAEFVATDLREAPEEEAEAKATEDNGNKFYLQVAYGEDSHGSVSGETLGTVLERFELDLADPLGVFKLPDLQEMSADNIPPSRMMVTLGMGASVKIPGTEKTIIEGMYFDVAEASFVQLKGTRLVMKSDGAEQPCVDVPIPYLFCAFWALDEYTSPFTSITDNKLVFLLHIPIGKGLEIGLAKFGDGEMLRSIKLTLLTREVYDPDPPPYRFCAEYREIISEKGQPLHLADIQGEGVFIGCTFAADGLEHRKFSFLEGNEQICVDGEEKPSWEGTGTEDFFNGAWYFSAGVKARAFHGLTYLNEDPPPRMSAYRYLIPDRIAFKKSLKFDMQHGSRNSVPDTLYKCVSFWYQKPPCKVREPVEAKVPEGGALGPELEAGEDDEGIEIDLVTPAILMIIVLLAGVAGMRYLLRRGR